MYNYSGLWPFFYLIKGVKAGKISDQMIIRVIPAHSDVVRVRARTAVGCDVRTPSSSKMFGSAGIFAGISDVEIIRVYPW